MTAVFEFTWRALVLKHKKSTSSKFPFSIFNNNKKQIKPTIIEKQKCYGPGNSEVKGGAAVNIEAFIKDTKYGRH